MEYITQEGDTLASVATIYTLSPTYGEAIGRYNELITDVIQTPVNDILEAGMYLQIPDEWIKPNVSKPNIYSPIYTSGPYASSQGISTPLMLAALGLGAFAFMSGGRKGTSTRRRRKRRR